MKIRNKKMFIFNLSFILYVFIVGYTFRITACAEEDTNCTEYEEFYKKEFTGKVSYKAYFPRLHNLQILKLVSDNDSIIIENRTKIWDYADLGDSASKGKMSDVLYITKKNGRKKGFRFNLGCTGMYIDAIKKRLSEADSTNSLIHNN